MIYVEGQYAFKFAIDDLKDFLNQDDLKEFTITRAVNNQTQVYGHGQSQQALAPAQVQASNPEGTDTTGMTTGVQFLTPSSQEEYFKGCHSTTISLLQSQEDVPFLSICKCLLQ